VGKYAHISIEDARVIGDRLMSELKAACKGCKVNLSKEWLDRVDIEVVIPAKGLGRRRSAKPTIRVQVFMGTQLEHLQRRRREAARIELSGSRLSPNYGSHRFGRTYLIKQDLSYNAKVADVVAVEAKAVAAQYANAYEQQKREQDTKTRAAAAMERAGWGRDEDSYMERTWTHPGRDYKFKVEATGYDSKVYVTPSDSLRRTITCLAEDAPEAALIWCRFLEAEQRLMDKADPPNEED
jgi:hypothetical protein